MSRTHALLHFSGEEFYVEDGNSKFGTLVQINRPLQLAANLPYCIQIGRTVFTILVRNPLKPYDPLARLIEPVHDVRTERNAGRQTMESNADPQQEGMIDSAINEAHPTLNKEQNNNLIYPS